MTFIGISGSRLPSSRVCVPSTILPVFLHNSTKPIRMQQVTIPTSIHPVTVQPSALYPSIHVSCMAPESTAISLAVVRFTSVTAAKAREAREKYSVSIVSFGAELGRPLILLMFNSSHNITKRFPSRCFVIKSMLLGQVSRVRWLLPAKCGRQARTQHGRTVVSSASGLSALCS